MRKDEAGQACPKTLGEYRDLCWALTKKTRAVEFLDNKIKESPNGRDEVVIAHDSQMRFLLFPMMTQEPENPDHNFLDPMCASKRALEREAAGEEE